MRSKGVRVRRRSGKGLEKKRYVEIEQVVSIKMYTSTSHVAIRPVARKAVPTHDRVKSIGNDQTFYTTHDSRPCRGEKVRIRTRFSIFPVLTDITRSSISDITDRGVEMFTRTDRKKRFRTPRQSRYLFRGRKKSKGIRIRRPLFDAAASMYCIIL